MQKNVRTAHMCARIIVHNCHTQHSIEQFWYLPSYPPDKHQSSDAVYWRGEGKKTVENQLERLNYQHWGFENSE